MEIFATAFARFVVTALVVSMLSYNILSLAYMLRATNGFMTRKQFNHTARPIAFCVAVLFASRGLLW